MESESGAAVYPTALFFVHTNDYLRHAGEQAALANPFVIDRIALRQLAAKLVSGNDPPCQIRTGQETLLPGKRVIGAHPADIETLLLAASREASAIRAAGGSAALIAAAACYHLRFESIHPLTDGNGRVGRYILARQCSGGDAVESTSVLDGILENKRYYVAVFLAPITDCERYELLVDLLARITGTAMAGGLLPTNVDFSIPNTVRAETGQFRFFPQPG